MQYATFQPTFLYESLYCLALGLALIWIDKHFQLKKFQVLALYCMGYTAGRFVFEEMRIDPAHTIGPLRINAWMSIAVFVIATASFFWLNKHGTPVVRPDRDSESPDPSRSEAQPDSA